MSIADGKDALTDLHEIRAMLAEFYDAPDQVEEWLNAPQELLDGEKPMDLIATGDGDRVRGVIKAMEDCVYL